MAETVTVRNMRLVNPSGTDLSSGEFHLNDRPGDLNGKTLGVLSRMGVSVSKVSGRWVAPAVGGIRPRGQRFGDAGRATQPIMCLHEQSA